MNTNKSYEDFWDMLEDVDELTNSKTDDSQFSLEEQLEQFSLNESKAIEKLKVLQARKKKMAAQVTAAKRKARNHRLFKLGEIVEQTLGREITDEDVEKFKAFLSEHEKNNMSFSKVMNADLERNNNE